LDKFKEEEEEKNHSGKKSDIKSFCNKGWPQDDMFLLIQSEHVHENDSSSHDDELSEAAKDGFVSSSFSDLRDQLR
jgi:hypothetical protein